MQNFVHLHVHTEYSFLDGAMQLHHLVKKVKDVGMPAVAMTDHGGMHGAVNFYKECVKSHVKPIIGCELYVVPDVNEKNRNELYHMVVLAKDNEGYQNLMKLTSFGFQNMYYKPRVSYDCLRKNSKGLIGLSACLGGEIPQILLGGLGQNDLSYMELATQKARFFEEVFDGDFYLELQRNGFESSGQEQVNKELREIAQNTGIRLVPTNDCHYLDKEDRLLQSFLTRISKDREIQYDTPGDLWVRTPEEMAELFEPELLQETVNIADKCNVEMTFGKHVFPLYSIKDGLTPDQEITVLCEEGLKKRGKDTDPVYQDRLQRELSEIIDNGFSTYLLIVADFIRVAREKGIMVGPGRGSAAGSLACYCLEITDLDPLPYNLLFERFINPERVSLPDIDVDFCEQRRPEIIQYMVDKYGEDKVAQIANFNSMQAKMAIRDIARAIGSEDEYGNPSEEVLPQADITQMTKLVYDGKSISSLMEEGVFDKELRKPVNAKILHYAEKAEGMVRGTGVHAAGIVVADTSIIDYSPTFIDKEGKVITQYDKRGVEDIGLVKIDFLGLRNMTLIQLAIENIKEQEGIDLDVRNIPLDDSKTFDLYCKGLVDGVFQMESEGMRGYLNKLQPTCFEDIIALIALFRPGPLRSGMTESFVARKKGREDVSYFGLDDMLEDILKPTYGVVVYQEQVMQLAQAVCGFSLGQADILRRAMGKKDPVEMASQKNDFVSGAIANGVREKDAEKLFEIIAGFAEYGFNKSHSAAYALISYQTAYLKAHYPMAFMTALLEVEKNNSETLGAYIAECQKTFSISTPNVLTSKSNFSMHNNEILFGLSGIKGVPEAALKDLGVLQKKWAKEGYPESISLLLAESKNFNMAFLNAMNKAGAFDCYEPNRALVDNNKESLVLYARSLIKAREKSKKNTNQISFFDSGHIERIKESPTQATQNSLGLPDNEIKKTLPWRLDVSLAFEREVLGFYVSGAHPVEAFLSPDIEESRKTIKQIKNTESSHETVDIIVSFESIRRGVHERENSKMFGKQYALGHVSDETGSIKFVCWGSDYEKITNPTSPDAYDGKQFVVGQCFKITCQITDDEYSWSGEGEIPKQIVIKDIFNLSCDLPKSDFYTIDTQASYLSDDALDDMHSLMQRHTAQDINQATSIIMMKALDDKHVAHWMEDFSYVVNVTPSFLKDINEWEKNHQSVPSSKTKKKIGKRVFRNPQSMESVQNKGPFPC